MDGEGDLVPVERVSAESTNRLVANWRWVVKLIVVGVVLFLSHGKRGGEGVRRGGVGVRVEYTWISLSSSLHLGTPHPAFVYVNGAGPSG